MKDVNIFANKFLKTMAYRVPSAGGFAAAFYSGFNSKF